MLKDKMEKSLRRQSTPRRRIRHATERPAQPVLLPLNSSARKPAWGRTCLCGGICLGVCAFAYGRAYAVLSERATIDRALQGDGGTVTRPPFRPNCLETRSWILLGSSDDSSVFQPTKQLEELGCKHWKTTSKRRTSSADGSLSNCRAKDFNVNVSGTRADIRQAQSLRSKRIFRWVMGSLRSKLQIEGG